MNIRLLLIVVCLSGCASNSQTQLQRRLTGFEGGPLTAMVERFGAPTQQSEIDGQRWLVWAASQESFAQAYYMGFENDPTYLARCRISALVSDDIVVQVLRDGNLEDCKILGLT